MGYRSDWRLVIESPSLYALSAVKRWLKQIANGLDPHYKSEEHKDIAAWILDAEIKPARMGAIVFGGYGKCYDPFEDIISGIMRKCEGLSEEDQPTTAHYTRIGEDITDVNEMCSNSDNRDACKINQYVSRDICSDGLENYPENATWITDERVATMWEVNEFINRYVCKKPKRNRSSSTGQNKTASSKS